MFNEYSGSGYYIELCPRDAGDNCPFYGRGNKVKHENICQLQKTLKKSASCIGVGVHTGVRATLTLAPAPADTGFVFIRTDVLPRESRISALGSNVTATQLGTSIANEFGHSVATIEHVLSALTGMGVDNAFIEIDGPEVPILDGSAEPFIELIQTVGLASQDAPRNFIEILEPIEVKDGAKVARLEPSEGFTLDVSIDFDSEAIGLQRAVFDGTKNGFVRDIAPARTFGFLHQVEALRAMGLSRGGSLDNAVVIDGDKIMNEGGLRFDDEFVRHKALDAVGDLALAGYPILGKYVASQSGHAMNVALVKALMANQKAYRVVTQPVNTRLFAAAGL